MPNSHHPTPLPPTRSPSERAISPAVRADHPQELQLIHRLVNGDGKAWHEFVAQYQRLIFSRVLNTLAQFDRGQDHAFAEDLCADVFELLLADDCRQLRRFEGRSRLSTWLDVVTRRVCIRTLSRSTADGHRHRSDEDQLASLAARTETDILAGGRRDSLRTAIRQLSGPDRDIVRMFYFEKRSYTEIATELNLSVNTIGPKLKRARGRLKRFIDAAPESDENHPTP